jgi:hypothetical protein
MGFSGGGCWPGLVLRRGLMLVLAAAGMSLGLGCISALGAQTRKLVNTFGSLSSPQGVAIDQSSGDVYVADTGNHRIEKFDALGNFLLAFGADVGGPGVNTCTSALTCVAGTPGSAPGQFTTAEFVAVDNDPASASFHDVYVADTGDNLVSKFDALGNLLEPQLRGAGDRLLAYLQRYFDLDLVVAVARRAARGGEGNVDRVRPRSKRLGGLTETSARDRDQALDRR